MIHKKSLNARLIFSVIVPVSCCAFAFGLLTIGHPLIKFTLWDGFGLAIVGTGVFIFNLYEEKPQKASIEHF
jgi:hypothetical protein